MARCRRVYEDYVGIGIALHDRAVRCLYVERVAGGCIACEAARSVEDYFPVYFTGERGIEYRAFRYRYFAVIAFQSPVEPAR